MGTDSWCTPGACGLCVIARRDVVTTMTKEVRGIYSHASKDNHVMETALHARGHDSCGNSACCKLTHLYMAAGEFHGAPPSERVLVYRKLHKF